MAARPLPEITLEDSSVSASCGVLILSASVEELVKLDSVIDNGRRLTVTPKTLYLLKDGVVKYCSDVERKSLEDSDSSDKILTLNQTPYLYSPFHYVYDNSTDYFDCRGYYLDSPVLKNKFFNDMNDTSDLQVSTQLINFNKVEEGWEILLQTKGNTLLRKLGDSNLIPQLFFTGVNEITPAYCNASLVERTEDGEFVFRCVLESNHDINSKDELSILNFKISESDTISKTVRLQDTLQVIYTVNDYNGVIGDSKVDALVNLDFVPINSKGLTHESLDVVFGESLEGLFTGYRTISGGVQYLRYEEDVVATHPQDVWKTDSDGKVVYKPNPDYDESDPTSPPLIGEILHRKGDVVEIDGVAQYSHRKGDPVKKNGELVKLNERKAIHECQLFFLDAKFRYATEKNSIDYANDLPRNILTFLNQDIRPMNKNMLNLNTLQYYPKKSLGQVSVNVSRFNNRVISSTQNPIVNVYVTEATFNNFESRKLIRKSIKEVLVNEIRKVEVNLDTIYQAIREKIEKDVVSFSIEPLGDNHDLNRYTIINPSESTNIGVLLELQTDGTLKLNDTCTVNFFITE